MIKIPLPPPINQMYKTTKSGGFYKDQKVKDWEEEAGWEIKIQRKGKPKFLGDVMVDMNFYLKRDRDIDGSIKPILDILAKVGVYENDSQVQALFAKKKKSKDPRVEVRINEI